MKLLQLIVFAGYVVANLSPVFGLSTKFHLAINNLVWQTDRASGYDPFDSVVHTDEVPFDLQYFISNDTHYFITFSTGGAQDTPGNNTIAGIKSVDTEFGEATPSFYNRKALGENSKHLIYQIFSQPGGQNVIKDGVNISDRKDVIYGLAKRTEFSPKKLNYYVSVPAGQVVPPGIYYDKVQVSVYEGIPENFGAATEIDSKTVNLSFEVKAVTIAAFEAPLGKSIFQRPITIKSNVPHYFSLEIANENNEETKYLGYINDKLWHSANFSKQAEFLPSSPDSDGWFGELKVRSSGKKTNTDPTDRINVNLIILDE